MKNILATFFIFIPFLSYGSTKDPKCFELEEIRTKLNVASSNYMNANSTKGIDGRPYKKRIVSNCVNGSCVIVGLNRFKKVYMPKHKDADTSGMVFFPEIDRGEELLHVSKFVNRLRELAKGSACKTKLFVHKKNRDVFMIKYEEDDITDRFVVKNSTVLTWVINSPVGNDIIRFN